MIALSLLLVLGTLALLGFHLGPEPPPFRLGAGQLIAPAPVLLLAALWGGVALAVASFARGRQRWKLGVALLELVPAAYASAYVFSLGALPAHTLALEVGDPFPGYALVDQDEAPHELAAGTARAPALYIFYRGHW